MPALTPSDGIDLDDYRLLFHTVGGADGALAIIAYLPDTQTVCCGSDPGRQPAFHRRSAG